MAFLKNQYNGMEDSLLARYAAGETTPDENRTVEKWMGASGQNRRYMEGLFIIIEYFNESARSEADENAAWETLSNKIQQHTNSKTPVRVFYKWMSAAAVVLLSAGAVFLLNKQDGTAKYAAAGKEITGNGLRTDTLPDGTQIILDKKSTLYYSNDFNYLKRIVRLAGGGYFKVVHDARKPLTITVNDLQITDVGTSFTIQSDSNKTAVTVQAGAVEITHKNKSVMLGQGERLTVLKNDTTLEKETAAIIVPAKQQPVSQVPGKKPGVNPVPEDPKKQKVIVRNIISDIVSMHLVNEKDSISWFGLTDEEFIVNTQKQSSKIHEAFTKKYHIKKDNGFFYGPVHTVGNGFFITAKELKE